MGRFAELSGRRRGDCRATGGNRPFHKPGTRTGRRFLSHGSRSAYVCRSSLIELKDDAAVRRQMVEDTVSVPVTAAGASRSGSSTAEPGRLADTRPSSGPAARSASTRVAARSRERQPGARAPRFRPAASSPATPPTAAAVDARGCRGSAVRASPEPCGGRAAARPRRNDGGGNLTLAAAGSRVTPRLRRSKLSSC